MNFLNIEEFVSYKSLRKLIVIEIIEINERTESTFKYTAILLKRNKSKIIIDSELLCGDASELNIWYSQLNDTDIPVAVVINTSKILYKILSKGNKTDLHVLLKENFPTVNSEEFFAQLVTFKTIHNSEVLTVARKSYVQSIIDRLPFKYNQVIACTLGPSHILHFYELIFNPETDNTYHVRLYNISFKIAESNVLSLDIASHFNNSSIYYSMRDKIISGNSVIAYSYGLEYFANPMTYLHISDTTLLQNFKEYNFRKKSKHITHLMLGILFVGLVTSSAVFTVYQKKYDILQSEHWNSKQAQALVDKKKEVSTKRVSILQTYGLLSNDKITLLADKIISELPQNVYLKKISIHPQKNLIDHSIVFDNNIMLLNGNCFETGDLEEWIKAIKKYNWVYEINIIEFKQTENRELYEFVLEINKSTHEY